MSKLNAYRILSKVQGEMGPHSKEKNPDFVPIFPLGTFVQFLFYNLTRNIRKKTVVIGSVTMPRPSVIIS